MWYFIFSICLNVWSYCIYFIIIIDTIIENLSNEMRYQDTIIMECNHKFCDDNHHDDYEKANDDTSLKTEFSFEPIEFKSHSNVINHKRKVSINLKIISKCTFKF